MHKLLFYRVMVLGVSLILVQCAQIGGLNFKKHSFGLHPDKVIWIQLAGLSLDHLSMLRFSYPSAQDVTSFEKMTCVGQLWGFNLFTLRSDAKSGFLSQLTGSQNIKNQCVDYKKKPIWPSFLGSGYKIGIFEVVQSKQESLDFSQTCQEG